MTSMDCILLVCITLLISISASSTYIPASYLSSDISFGESARKVCPVNFKIQNYTILTSQCKAPSYPDKPCCKAFLEFACPLAKFINDMSTSCAQSMLIHINSHGYPPNLFAKACSKLTTDKGIPCPNPHTILH